MSPLYIQKQLKPIHFTLGMILINFVWRLVWLPASQGSYTDGILQIGLFRHGLTFWPPLYTVLALPLAWVPGLGMEGSARLVSVIAGSLAVVPIDAIGRRLFGQRAALMAMLAYTVSPMPLRWSMQVMTDATFMALWMASLASLAIAAAAIWPGLFDQGDEKGQAEAHNGYKWLMLASLFGALATLTRYQGIFLLPLVALTAFRWTQTSGAPKPPRPLLLLFVPWLIVPAWLLHAGLGPIANHIAQISERTTPESTGQTLANYLMLFEQFLLSSPYFITYGIFGFFLFGLFRTQFATKRLRLAAYASIYLALAILILQSVFQAFQERYLLPLVPLVCIGAGHGLAVWEKKWKEKPARFWALAGPALGYALVFSALVALYQGNPFIDMKRAGRLLREAPEDATIYATERYNRDIGAAKLSYWSDHAITPFGKEIPVPGDYIVLSSFYGRTGAGGGGGWREYQVLKKEVETAYPYPVAELGRFAYVSLPLFPDIMEETITHTNPLAFIFRYRLQRFESVVYKVVDEDAAPRPLPAAPAESENESRAE